MKYKFYIIASAIWLLPSAIWPSDLKFIHHDEFSRSSNYVRAIYKDSKGFMWFGTEKGAYQFDGYRFYHYKNTPNDSNSIADSYVFDIAEDSRGNLFFATRNGVSIYDREKDQFENFHEELYEDPHLFSLTRSVFVDREDKVWLGTINGIYQILAAKKQFVNYCPQPDSSLHGNGLEVNSIAEDHNDGLWLGTWGGGVLFFNKKTTSFKRFLIDSTSFSSAKNTVNEIELSYDNHLWVATNNGIYKFDVQNGKFNHKNNVFEKNVRIGNENIHSLHNDDDKELWAGTTQSVYWIDLLNNQFKVYKNDPQKEGSLAIGANYSLYRDDNKTLWIGNRTINQYSPYRNKFDKFYKKPANSKMQDYCTSFVYEKGGSIWISTFGNGILRYYTNKQKFERITTQNSPLLSNNINCLLDSKSETIWAGTTEGISIFNSVDGTFKKHFSHNDKLNHINIYLLYLDHQGNIWICTQEGVNIWNQYTQQLQELKYEKRGYNFKIRDIIEDTNGNIWLGSMNGIIKLKYESGKFVQHDENFNSVIDHLIIYDLHLDNEGVIWMGTNSGLYKYDKEHDDFTLVDMENEYSSISITGILEDEQRNLWLVAAPYLLKLNKDSMVYKYYDKDNGASFNSRNPFKHPVSHAFFIGGEHRGFFHFHPDSILDNPNIPQVYINDFKIFNKNVPIGNESVLKKHISYTDTLVLSYKTSVFSFGFTALNYVLPQKNRYAYTMVGFDDDWRYTDANNRVATYTNLNPGKYIFKVKASNNDGIWNEKGDSIVLIITPPWWRTWQASIGFILALVFIYWSMRYLVIKKERMVSELRKNHEVNLLRLRFFTNVSHEFRTPLTLISGPLQRILKRQDLNTEISGQLTLVYNNVLKLLKLVNQVMDIRRVETGNVNLALESVEIVDLVKRVTTSFIEETENKNIQLVFTSSPASFKVMADPDVIEKITTNLVSNAIKYTPGDEIVNVEVLLQEKYSIGSHDNENAEYQEFFIIRISDTGLGIPEKDKQHIFSRYFRSHEFGSLMSSGIGLNYVKELIELHGGTVNVSDNSPTGTVFTVRIPVRSKAIIDESTKTDFLQNEQKVTSLEKRKTKIVAQKPKKNELILVVEDNEDMLHYLLQMLGEEGYNTLRALNGREGLGQTRQHLPDLIISDVMMPFVDGIEMCRELKTDASTNHIPIVLLTAKVLVEHQFEGFQTGADAYIAKPFDEELLLLRVSNIFKNRSILQEKIRQELLSNQSVGGYMEKKPDQSNKEAGMDDSETKNASKTNEYIMEIKKLVEANYHDENFNTEVLSKKLLVTRQYLHRKFVGITGITPSQYIKEFRLLKAKEILENDSRLTISEVAFKTGFKYASGFSRAYKNYFGTYPTE